MEIMKFEDFIKRSRDDFRACVEMNLDRTDLKDMLRAQLDECGCDFEEITLRENLQEEFGLYLKSIA